MTNTTLHDSQNDLDSLSQRAFSAHVAKLRKQHGVASEVKIKKANFESLDDLNAYMKYYDRAETSSGKPTAKTSRQTRTTSATSAKAKSAIAAELAKKKSARDAKRPRPTARVLKRPRPTARVPQIPKTKPPRQGRTTAPASRPISSLMRPGLYDSDPWRQVGLKHLPREIEASTAKFRRTRIGLGKCTGSKLKAVTSAFTDSYYYAESARQEVAAIRQSPDAALLWHASRKYEEASLAYWFGADYSPTQINRMLAKIEAILTEWSLAHCAGFRGLLPVWIRCKSRNGVGDGTARHYAANMIELFPKYFGKSQNQRSVIILHEMGHRSTALLKPRDEQHDVCKGGWKRSDDMCYRKRDQVDNSKNGNDNRFSVGNPRNLAMAATKGDVSARKTALNNIDNYVSYMWNRHRDHRSQMIYLLSPGAKEPRQPPRDSTPASKPT